MTALSSILSDHWEIGLFLALALGYAIGKIKIVGHAMGLVTGSLFAGLLIGQLGVEIRPEVKTVFLLLFLFANGYGAGPQFFRALRSDGVKPLILTLLITFLGLGCVYGMARLMGLETGFAAGLLSGALTQSSAIGTASEAIMGLDLPMAERQRLVNQIPVADAVCYLFGFWGEVFFVAMLLPKLLKIDLEKEARALDAKLGLSSAQAGVKSAYRLRAARSHRVENAAAIGLSVGEIEARALAQGARVVLHRLRRDGEIRDCAPADRLAAGDIVVVAGLRAAILETGALLGPEHDDADLLDMPIETLDAVVTNRKLAGQSLGQLAAERPEARGIFVKSLRRGGQAMPLAASTVLNRGDVLTLIGPVAAVERAVVQIGFADRATVTTDMLTIGLGVAAGCLIGLPAVTFFGIKLSLSTAVGTLLMGLFFGWFRSVKPNLLGRVPEASQAFMMNFGLAGFVAMTGLHAGPVFLPALMESGVALFIAGVVCTCVPPTVGAFFGKYVLKMNPVLLLGAVSGAQTMTAAMVAVQEQAKSRAPVLGFTVPYALGNIILTIWGTVIVLLMAE
ncbi:aspartate-alanine antiporter [Humitalea sp. 24SJ18S-53]|uniref:aspartate-alanine antiporter n=1 Tax=Humitalea sp. 24SJ18S-53 TaxID=3422307 RepID=UPI003D670284